MRTGTRVAASAFLGNTRRMKGGRTIAVVFDPGDEVSLETLATDEQLGGTQFTAIGALRSVTLGGFLDLGRRDCRRHLVEEQCEVVSLIGNVALDGGAANIHAHAAVLGLSDGATRGGDLLEGWVQPTLEVVIVEMPRHLQRKPDPARGSRSSISEA